MHMHMQIAFSNMISTTIISDTSTYLDKSVNVVQTEQIVKFHKGPLHNYVTPKSAVFYPPTHHVTIINV